MVRHVYSEIIFVELGANVVPSSLARLDYIYLLPGYEVDEVFVKGS